MNLRRSYCHLFRSQRGAAGSRALIVAIALGASGVAAMAQTAAPLKSPQHPSATVVPRQRDEAAGAMLDSLFDSASAPRDRQAPAMEALGGRPSRASLRARWTARLARNPRPADGNPPYVLIDRYGGIQRYVEPVATIDLEKHIGKMVAVRRDTGHTLLASQLELPRSAAAGVLQGGGSAADDITLATFEQAAQALEPTPAPGGEPLPEATAPPSEPVEGEVIEGEIIDGQPIEGPMFDADGHPLEVHEGVDPLYLDDSDAMQFDGCPTCGDTICQMQGGCGFGSRPVLYARGEYLLWWIDGMPIPPLVVRGEANNNGTPGDPDDDFFDNAFVVFGDEDVLEESRSGGRITIGYWLDDYGQWAVEGDYFSFGEIQTHFVDGGDGTFPIVGRPFIDATTGLPAVEDVSFPGIRGDVTADVTSTFQSAGLRFRRNLCCVAGAPECGDAVQCGSTVSGCLTGGCGTPVGGDTPLARFFNRGTRHIDVTYGVRWAQLEEGLNIREDLQTTDATTTFVVVDDFATSNEFVGGELGFIWDWQYRRWSVESLLRLGIGNTRQRVAINGFTLNNGEFGVGGLLAQESNIGNYERNEFSVLPQIGVTLGYMITDRLKLTGGYTLLYWSRVVRPGEQIDLEVNPGNLPFANPPDADGLPARPEFVFRDTSIWAHGLNVGLEYQW
ncbi:MAG: hypothetical protein DCC67_15060 [Planctomycetota bacterium]|nr:MAG: hypothetical protein DCC67_15060 [Planctomycetota bacterium]